MNGDIKQNGPPVLLFVGYPFFFFVDDDQQLKGTRLWCRARGIEDRPGC